jgi:hypothetical protein
MDSTVETLSEVEPFDEIRVTLVNGSSIVGRANPIEYSPESHLRVEIEEVHDGPTHVTRYDVRAEHTVDGWDRPQVRRHDPTVEEDTWVHVGDVGEVKIIERDRDPDHL